jgi:hypothetical protein
MGDMLKRIAREWVVIVTGLAGAAFIVSSSTGWLQYIFGYQPDSVWVYLAVFVVFVIVVMIRLTKLHSTIDKIQGNINFTATPTKFYLNCQLPNEPPLEKDEASFYTTVRFEIWTDIDINTSRLVLNLVSFRNLFVSGWEFWKPFKMERVIGIPMVGSEDSTYRKKIKGTDLQPFQDTVSFRFRGKVDKIAWAKHHMPELALELGIPKRILRVYLSDPKTKKGGNEVTPL